MNVMENFIIFCKGNLKAGVTKPGVYSTENISCAPLTDTLAYFKQYTTFYNF